MNSTNTIKKCSSGTNLLALTWLYKLCLLMWFLWITNLTNIPSASTWTDFSSRALNPVFTLSDNATYLRASGKRECHETWKTGQAITEAQVTIFFCCVIPDKRARVQRQDCSKEASLYILRNDKKTCMDAKRTKWTFVSSFCSKR